MNIDTLNAYCGPWLVYCPYLAQGRLNIHLDLLLGLGFSRADARVAFKCLTGGPTFGLADPRDLSRVGGLVKCGLLSDWQAFVLPLQPLYFST